MVKIKQIPLGFDPLTAFQTNPHDKYARFILKIQRVVIAMLKEFAPEQVVKGLDLSSLETTSESFLDEQLKAQFSDICYSVRLKGAKQFKITILIEHKSTAYQGSVVFQLIRYIGNIRQEYERQGMQAPLVLPIVLYHGDTAMVYETPQLLYPDVPEYLLEFVPYFRYLLIDLHKMNLERIFAIPDILLQKFFLTLKNSRNERFIEENWKEMHIFAEQNAAETVFYNQVTLLYLSSTSKTYKNRFSMNTATLLPSEANTLESIITSLYSQGVDVGMEKGMEKGMEIGVRKMIIAFLHKNPDLSDAAVASNFDIPIRLVTQIRKSMTKKG